METLKNRLKRLEGLRLKPYVDTTGKLSIGFGRNLVGVGISESEADIMFANDFDKAVNLYRFKIPEAVQRHCNTARVEVLICMIFQMGLGGVLKFKRMLTAISVGDFECAAVEMIDSLWGRQTPNRAHELAGIMRSGV